MLDDRVIAVAGVGGGLGPLVAAELARAGATVAGTDRSQETLDAIAADLGLPPERWDGRAVDLLDEEAARGWCAALVERFGRVDGLVHLVGGWRGGRAAARGAARRLGAAPRPPRPHRPAHDPRLPRPARRQRRTAASSSSPPSRRRRRPTPTPPTRPPRPPPRPGPSPSPTASKPRRGDRQHRRRRRDPDAADARGGSRTRSSRPSPRPRTSPTAIAFLCSDAAKKMNGQRLPLTMGR